MIVLPCLLSALLLSDDGNDDLHEDISRVATLLELAPAHHRGVVAVVAPVGARQTDGSNVVIENNLKTLLLRH